MRSTGISRRLGGLEVRRRRHRRLAVVAIVLLLVAGALVLLGGDDDGAEPGATPTTVEDVDRTALAAATTVEEVCTVSNAQLASLYNALLRDNPSPSAAADFLGGAFVDLVRLRVDALRALEPGDDVLAIVDELEAAVAAVDADPEAALEVNPFDAVNGSWREAGLGSCAIDPTTVAGDA